MNWKKTLELVLKVSVGLLVILSVLIYNFIIQDERDKYQEKAELYEAKYDQSLIFIKEYKSAVDSIIDQKQDSIVLLLKQLDSN